MILALVNLVRVRQWTKNTFVLAIPFFAGELTNLDIWRNSLTAFFGFCICSSLVYVINDLSDLKEDLKNPNKAKRPLVSGALSRMTAVICGLILAFILACAILFESTLRTLTPIFLLYVVINVFYSKYLKNIPIIELVLVSLGFVLRLFAGAIATSLNPTAWIVVCTWLLSLFMVIGKRMAELNRRDQRKVLKAYNLELLKILLASTFCSALMSYTLFCIDANTQDRFGKLLYLTIPLVFSGLAIYAKALVVDKTRLDPTTLIFTNKALLISGLLWCVFFAGSLYFVPEYSNVFKTLPLGY